MSDNLQHELDDELLSAYLDDELSANQRALVERRLAADPDARQTLREHLRSVSQAVRDLPRQSLGRDLSESILQRVADVPRSRVSPRRDDAKTSQTGARGLKLTIGRSTRAWIWASLAVAAALLIMVVQPDDESDPASGDVAQRTSEPLQEKEQFGADAPELRAWNEPVSTDSASGLAAVDSSELVPSEAAPAPPTSAPAPTGELSVAAEAPAAPSAGARLDRAAAPRDFSGTLADGQVADQIAAPEAGGMLVVHVLAKPDALRSKRFDKILQDNGIAFESHPSATDETPVASRAYRAQVSSGREEQRAGVETSFAAGCEVVLVEAQPNAIVSCMAALNEDSSNYLCVEVDNPATADEAPSVEAPPVKKLAEDLGKYSRGVMPQEQKEVLARDKATYYQFDAFAKDARGSESASGGRAGLESAPPPASESIARKSEMEQGRARRVQSWGAENRSAGERSDRFGALTGAGPEVDALLRRELLSQLKSPAEAGGDTCQVLFFLCPTMESAPSPAAANQTE